MRAGKDISGRIFKTAQESGRGGLLSKNVVCFECIVQAITAYIIILYALSPNRVLSRSKIENAGKKQPAPYPLFSQPYMAEILFNYVMDIVLFAQFSGLIII